MSNPLQYAGLFVIGVLAGEELIVRYGLHPALSRLDDHPHLLARQALVRRLRVVVPIVMLPAAALAAAVLVVVTGPGLALRWATVLAMVTFLLLSFLGTVPINIKVGGWRADAPPPGWQAVIARWARLDILRSAAATAAFLFAVLAVAQAN
ncbi:hypothetical protein AMES_4327 [Amycolatopsis mediterranei S699]|uniref:Integral membrane protein n=2 Tax=Amycolatopsis mediterranei TaxID=33910 RepID=A0A0H3D749_AMYMU|nr:DUF1772 domain-containing protein [Amycolatopsis mediterranei]ADJ46152.1 conserved hypothetical protein [Amycolatopsis mediterranei U32]AEK42942.1 hypothetical protein RAM_22310 [Amycolatopsis mediterranei S699]AFO77863.1 hypothetical protein AMES_4327 [Amycolatopsis mediterranei S699]AGT84991.1 hypothetical protein B737_4327 [Amycolatopsis mediterranei RB]KDO05688.1 hypothetical protein DV26_39315 [Amycolatopsis mediterranei]